MKRFTLILVLVLMVAMPMMAERVTPETARKVAATFLSNNGAKAAQLTNLSKAAGFPNLYIFSTKESFVVMAADDCVKPILGYSLTGNFVTEDMPENVRGWLQGYSDEIQHAVDNRMSASSETAKLWKDLTEGNSKAGKTTTVVVPLIQTKWNQSPYYNDMCPYDSQAGARTVTGCVATAMAQIMKFWEYPDHGIGSHSYTDANYGQLDANFGNATYTWADMPNSINSANSEIAQLMYHCGVSVDMEYGLSSQYGGIGSSAYSNYIPSALINYFNYSDSTNFVERYKYQDDEDWKNLLKKELDKRRPVQYSGSGSGGGHAFICDGYDSDDKFHFNWGWGGSNDAFYSINGLTPGSSNYNYDQTAVIGIKPAIIGQATAPTLSVELVQETGVRNAQLTWNKVDDATKYQIYRNTTLIHTTISGEDVSFTDVHIPYGTNTYFIRSVDENDNLSWPSNYVSLTLTFTAPTNLSAQSTENGVMLSWTAGENAVSYNVYCNNVLIGSVNATTYIDSRTIAGSLSYFVKSVDALNDESEASEATQIAIQYSTPIVESLSAAISDGKTSLSWAEPNWCYPEAPSFQLTYGTQNPCGSSMIWGSNASVFWGHRHLAEAISTYNGKKLYKASFYASNLGVYELYIFQGSSVSRDSSVIPSELVTYQIITVSELGWNAIDLSTPIVINGEQDLWIFMHNPVPIENFRSEVCSANGSYGFYYSGDPTSYTYNNVEGYAFLIKAFITDGTYTYNLYDGTNPIASNIADTCYSIENIRGNALHQYTVKTNFNGSETAPSNKASIAMGTYALSDLNLENDRMFVSENSSLTVTDDLTCTNPDHLILENGAQLINDSEGVQATVKKAIQPYTEGKRDGWNLIASPVIESLDAEDIPGLLQNEYDLYAFNASGTDDQGNAREWRNYKAQSFNINNKVGYLYANSSETTLSFVGTLASNTGATELAWDEDAYFAGFNLIGNPYPCNAYLDRSFYVLEYDIVNNSTKFVLGENPIAPCAAVLVQTQADEDVATFSKTAPSTSSKIAVRLNQADQKGATAIDQVRIMFQQQSQLAKYPQESSASMIYIPQNGKKLAVANAEGLTELPINLRTAKNGSYTLSFETEKLDLNYLHLIDNMTGDDVDLLSTPSYTFNANTNHHDWRFRLVFASNCEDAVDDNETFAYVSNGEIVINQEGTLQIVDMTGRIIVSHSGRIQCVPTTGMALGVYVLRLINGDNVKTQKIVIE